METNRIEQNLFIQITIGVTLGKKEGVVLFSDALNTFYLRLYGLGQ